MRNKVYEDPLAPHNVGHAAAGSTRLDWPPVAHTRACVRATRPQPELRRMRSNGALETWRQAMWMMRLRAHP
eukprot:9867608-Alexandrium_andersonii.AAC.1